MSEIASKGQLRMSLIRWAVVTIPLVLLLGFLAGASVPSGADNVWYAGLAKPALTPPDWVFPVAWSLLYLMIGLALAMVLNARGSRWRWPSAGLFAIAFLFNLAWNPIFFGKHLVGAALAIIVVMFVLSVATTFLFGRIRTVAAWLMVPYLAWIVFAACLTYGIDQLNPNAAGLVPSSSTTQISL